MQIKKHTKHKEKQQEKKEGFKPSFLWIRNQLLKKLFMS